MSGSQPRLTLSEFQDLLDRHGPELAHWPAASAEAARDLLGRSAEARALLKEAHGLSRLFAAEGTVRAPAGLAGRIARAAMTAAPPKPSQSASFADWIWEIVALAFGPGAGWMRPAAALAICFAVGIGASLLAPQQSETVAALGQISAFGPYFNL